MARRRKGKPSYKVQGVNEVRKRYKNAIGKIERSSESVLNEIGILVQNEAAYLTPQDTNALLNSQYRQFIAQNGRETVRIGYTQGYAAAIHNRTDWQPRRPTERSPQGGAYNPNATDHFLVRGAQAARPDIQRLLLLRYGQFAKGGKR